MLLLLNWWNNLVSIFTCLSQLCQLDFKKFSWCNAVFFFEAFTLHSGVEILIMLFTDFTKCSFLIGRVFCRMRIYLLVWSKLVKLVCVKVPLRDLNYANRIMTEISLSWVCSENMHLAPFCAHPDLVVLFLLTLWVQNAPYLWQLIWIFYYYVMLVTKWNVIEAYGLINIRASFTIKAVLVPFWQLKQYQPHIQHRTRGQEI